MIIRDLIGKYCEIIDGNYLNRIDFSTLDPHIYI